MTVFHKCKTCDCVRRAVCVLQGSCVGPWSRMFRWWQSSRGRGCWGAALCPEAPGPGTAGAELSAWGRPSELLPQQGGPYQQSCAPPHLLLCVWQPGEQQAVFTGLVPVSSSFPSCPWAGTAPVLLISIVSVGVRRLVWFCYHFPWATGRSISLFAPISETDQMSQKHFWETKLFGDKTTFLFLFDA